MAFNGKFARALKRGRQLARRVRGPGKKEHDSGPAVVQFGDQSIEVPLNTTLLSAAQQLDLDLDHFCGGNCSCVSCRMQVLDGEAYLSNACPDELMVLGVDSESKGGRLACQAQVRGPVSVQIPDYFMV